MAQTKFPMKRLRTDVITNLSQVNPFLKIQPYKKKARKLAGTVAIRLGI